MAKKAVTAPLIPRSCISIFDRNRLVAEGIEQIAFLSEERIELCGKEYLCVSGSCLKLKELGNDNIEILGRIASVCFERHGL